MSHHNGFLYDWLFERRDLTIEQKWLYLVFLHEESQGNHAFFIAELAKNQNIMTSGSLIRRNIYALEKAGLLHFSVQSDTWNIRPLYQQPMNALQRRREVFREDPTKGPLELMENDGKCQFCGHVFLNGDCQHEVLGRVACDRCYLDFAHGTI